MFGNRLGIKYCTVVVSLFLVDGFPLSLPLATNKLVTKEVDESPEFKNANGVTTIFELTVVVVVGLLLFHSAVDAAQAFKLIHDTFVFDLDLMHTTILQESLILFYYLDLGRRIRSLAFVSGLCGSLVFCKALRDWVLLSQGSCSNTSSSSTSGDSAGGGVKIGGADKGGDRDFGIEIIFGWTTSSEFSIGNN
ncbi:hypothetical protein AGLY_011816, partial [Aphis glycines]